MAWTYTDWESQPTDSERLARLRLHIAEVSADIRDRAISVNADGKAMTRQELLGHLQFLSQQRDALKASPGVMTAGGRSLVRFRKAT